MAYMHGTYGEFDKTINTIPVKSGTIPVYIGTAHSPLQKARRKSRATKSY